MRKPKNWDSLFRVRVIKDYTSGKLTLDNIEDWEIDYNDGRKPNPPFNTKELLDYYIKTNKSKRISKLLNFSSESIYDLTKYYVDSKLEYKDSDEPEDEFGENPKYFNIYNSNVGWFGLDTDELTPSEYDEVSKKFNDIFGKYLIAAENDFRNKRSKENKKFYFLEGELNVDGVPITWSAGVSDGLSLNIPISMISIESLKKPIKNLTGDDFKMMSNFSQRIDKLLNFSNINNSNTGFTNKVETYISRINLSDQQKSKLKNLISNFKVFGRYASEEMTLIYLSYLMSLSSDDLRYILDVHDDSEGDEYSTRYEEPRFMQLLQPDCIPEKYAIVDYNYEYFIELVTILAPAL